MTFSIACVLHYFSIRSPLNISGFAFEQIALLILVFFFPLIEQN